jgi:hypothetical protein
MVHYHRHCDALRRMLVNILIPLTGIAQTLEWILDVISFILSH